MVFEENVQKIENAYPAIWVAMPYYIVSCHTFFTDYIYLYYSISHFRGIAQSLNREVHTEVTTHVFI